MTEPACLGVQEGRSAVGRYNELSAKGICGPLGLQLLDGEEEGDALSAWQLHCDRCVVDAVLLLQLHVAAAVDLKVSRDLCIQ